MAVESLMSEQEDEDAIQEIQARLATLEQENQELRAKVSQHADRIDELGDDRQWLMEFVFELEEFAMGDWTDTTFLNELGYESLGDAVLDLTNTVSLEEIKDLRERQQTDHRCVKHELAKIRRQMNHVAEETEVELLDVVPGDDKIAMIRRNGIGSVVSTVYKSHERAEEIINNLEDWSTLRKDKNGAKAYLHAPTVKDKLEIRRDESLQTNQIKRAFEKIAELAEDSSRIATVRKNKQGTWELVLGVGTK